MGGIARFFGCSACGSEKRDVIHPSPHIESPKALENQAKVPDDSTSTSAPLVPPSEPFPSETNGITSKQQSSNHFISADQEIFQQDSFNFPITGSEANTHHESLHKIHSIRITRIGRHVSEEAIEIEDSFSADTPTSMSNQRLRYSQNDESRHGIARIGRSNSSDANLYPNASARRPSLNQKVLMAHFGPIRSSAPRESSVGIVIWAQHQQPNHEVGGESIPVYSTSTFDNHASSSMQLKPNTTLTSGCENLGESTNSGTGKLPESITVTSQSDEDILADIPVWAKATAVSHAASAKTESNASDGQDNTPKVIVTRGRRSSISMVELPIGGLHQNDPLTKFHTLKARQKPKNDSQDSTTSSTSSSHHDFCHNYQNPQETQSQKSPSSIPSNIKPHSRSKDDDLNIKDTDNTTTDPSTASLSNRNFQTNTSTTESSQQPLSVMKSGNDVPEGYSSQRTSQNYYAVHIRQVPHIGRRATQSSSKVDATHSCGTFSSPRGNTVDESTHFKSEAPSRSRQNSKVEGGDAILKRKDVHNNGVATETGTDPSGGITTGANRFLRSIFTASHQSMNMTTTPQTSDSLYSPTSRMSVQNDTRSRRSSYDTDAHIRRGAERKKRLEESNKKLARELEDLKFQQLLATIPKVNSFYELDA